MRILGIESSCDETAAAVLEGDGRAFAILANVVHGQLDIHADFGGVVPELASRAHIRNIGPVVATALAQARVSEGSLDGIAVTVGPGLVGALLVGVAMARGMAMALGRPLLAIHHMEGHLMSPFLAGVTDFAFPFVALLVSGGHTLLVHALDFARYQVLGQTRDDSVGEAFDKGARMLGLTYPGGPAIAQLALHGNPHAFAFPRAMLDRTRHDFSYSGLKTALRTFLEREGAGEVGSIRQQDIAASFQEALIEPLVIKSLAACRTVGAQRLVVAGGVGANQRLRERLTQAAEVAGVRVLFPPVGLCTDNGAMIACAGLRRLAAGARGDTHLNARPRWSLAELMA
ncbi:MAG: tRNA (adenosine(37)-N6)-threonylcarbamoyltransferase complex transferase subunit TsaD [Magnetococcales bacterium]|nr:tRNA (adenosine(37)-N6)-threonylcarbamoyltransferase complex transferase subunit TsaD [Magnetococcales bacterium]MBF0322922.1 tRNA (adenosine(37)-N6)-threonylcarbamoyltransferase complex transferase subunit TsaD [Magnetococcales bacterium]